MSDEKLTEADDLIARLKSLRPDLVVVPREPQFIMCLRGYQAEGIFFEPDGLDCACDWFDLSEAGEIPGWPDESNTMCGEDMRLYLLVAAIWRGCISGLEEWQSRRAEEISANTAEGHRKFLDSWIRPVPTSTASRRALAENGRHG